MRNLKLKIHYLGIVIYLFNSNNFIITCSMKPNLHVSDGWIM